MFRRFTSKVPNSARLGLAAYGGGAIFVLITTTSFSSLVVEGSSMAPTLSPDFERSRSCDRVLFAHYKPSHSLQRGDVVAFWTPHNPERMAIKRVIALPGDEVIPFPNRPYSEWLRKQAFPEQLAVHQFGNSSRSCSKEEDTPLDPEVSNDIAISSIDPLTEPALVVPYNHVWVEGDNWRQTRDSNDYGPISQSLITGKALWILSPSRFGPIDKDALHGPITSARVKTHIGQALEPEFYY